MAADHIVDDARQKRIAKRMELYLHAARRVVVDVMGPEVGHKNAHVVTELASAMATLEAAEIVASSQDKIAAILEEKAD